MQGFCKAVAKQKSPLDGGLFCFLDVYFGAAGLEKSTVGAASELAGAS